MLTSGAARLATPNLLGYFGIMEIKKETTIVYWGYVGIMEKKMETTIVKFDEVCIQVVIDAKSETLTFQGQDLLNLCRVRVLGA